MLDVAIIGGGPGGSTAGALLKKYARDLQVTIFEKETFPRDHVGESQLPPISAILDEMGCWDKVEAANFPIKIGATYRWGKTPELWDFYFLPVDQFQDEPRPATYTGQRKTTAFQVDRARYDQILLEHAQELGCEVRQNTKIAKVHCKGDSVDHLELADGEKVRAKHYIDASGSAAILRKAMGVKVTEPAALKNIAIWDYWQNADWAEEIGVGGTMVQVLSIANGWIWFIPLSPTRTSIGYICPASHYQKSGKTTEQLYLDALPCDERLQSLLKNAKRENKLQATKDWSFLADRLVGENWLLVGETAGFADPILAAGMTLTQAGAREAAYTILAIEGAEHDAGWLKTHYEGIQQRRIKQHIRFADFWYAANGQFSDLTAYTAKIAKNAGLSLSPRNAFQWLGTGGFTNDVAGQAGIGGLDLAGLKQITGRFTQSEMPWELNRYNQFKLNLSGVKQDFMPVYRDGKIIRQKCFVRARKVLPVTGLYELLVHILKQTGDVSEIATQLVNYFTRNKVFANPQLGVHHGLQALEVMLAERWVKGKFDKNRPKLELSTPIEGEIIHTHHEKAAKTIG